MCVLVCECLSMIFIICFFGLDSAYWVSERQSSHLLSRQWLCTVRWIKAAFLDINSEMLWTRMRLRRILSVPTYHSPKEKPSPTRTRLKLHRVCVSLSQIKNICPAWRTRSEPDCDFEILVHTCFGQMGLGSNTNWSVEVGCRMLAEQIWRNHNMHLLPVICTLTFLFGIYLHLWY